MVDAGPLYAYVDRAEPRHAECLELLRTWPGRLIVPILVIAEVTYLVGTRLGPRAEVLLLGDIASGTLQPEPVHAADWMRITRLVARYADFPLGTTDASVVAAAERLEVDDVATLDRRHFSAVVPDHVPAFTLLP